MRLTGFLAALAVATPLVGPSSAVAQTASSPLTIHNVRLHELSGELTITGTGFGSAPTVAVDGQPVPCCLAVPTRSSWYCAGRRADHARDVPADRGRCGAAGG